MQNLCSGRELNTPSRFYKIPKLRVSCRSYFFAFSWPLDPEVTPQAPPLAGNQTGHYWTHSGSANEQPDDHAQVTSPPTSPQKRSF